MAGVIMKVNFSIALDDDCLEQLNRHRREISASKYINSLLRKEFDMDSENDAT